MAKKVIGMVKLQIPAGKANPAPPVGPALGQHGVNIMEFCKAFNAKTQNAGELKIPVVITVYADRSFSSMTRTPPAPYSLTDAAGADTCSATPNTYFTVANHYVTFERHRRGSRGRKGKLKGAGLKRHVRHMRGNQLGNGLGRFCERVAIAIRRRGVKGGLPQSRGFRPEAEFAMGPVGV